MSRGQTDACTRAKALRAHGYTVIRETNVPKRLLEEIKADALKRARCNGGQRTSINDWANVIESAWWRLAEWCMDKGSTVGAIMDQAFGDCWFFDVAGGEAVAPHAPWASRECSAHSDWKGVRMGIIVISFIVHASVTDDMAPLVIYSNKDGRAERITGAMGTVIMRDVSAIHHGSPNLSSQTVIKPCVRFLTAAALQQGYRPRPFLREDVFRHFDRRTFMKMHFCCDSSEEEAAEPNRRFDTPPSLLCSVESNTVGDDFSMTDFP